MHVPVGVGVEDGEAAHGGRRDHVRAVVALDEAGLLRLLLRERVQPVVHHHRLHGAELVLAHQLHHAPGDELLEVPLPDLLHGAPSPRPHEALGDPQPHQPRRVHRGALTHRRQVQEARLEVVRQVVERQRHDTPAVALGMLPARRSQLRHHLVPRRRQLLRPQDAGEDDDRQRKAAGDPEHVLVVPRLVPAGAVATAAEHPAPEHLVRVLRAQPGELDRRAGVPADHLKAGGVGDEDHPAAVALVGERGAQAVPVGDGDAAVDDHQVPPPRHVLVQLVADVLSCFGAIRGVVSALLLRRSTPQLGARLAVDVAEDVGGAALVREHRPRAYLEVVADLGALVHLPRQRRLADAALAGDGHESARGDGLVEELLFQQVTVLVQTDRVLLQIIPGGEGGCGGVGGGPGRRRSVLDVVGGAVG
uniref:Uncharacterized protein n=1 Tax=Arundo donax TaxID=35708 RepID=A0A0A8ZGI0_ARUDO